MTIKQSFSALLAFSLALIWASCKPSGSGPWKTFTQCTGKSCVPEALAVKDAFLKTPQPLLTEFSETYSKGEDHVIGWLYLLRDSVLLNEKFGSLEQRLALQQSLVNAAKPFENDAKVAEMAKSVLQEIGNLSLTPKAPEAETESGEEEMVDESLPLTGTYAYDLGEKLGSGEIKVCRVNGDSIRFSLEIVGHAPAYNQGSMENIAKLVSQNVYESVTSEYGGKCRLQFTFGPEKVVIKTMEGASPECGFGNAVMADQTYTRKSYDDPFLKVAETKTAKNLLGKWRSIDDAKSEIEIAKGSWDNIYDGKRLDQTPYQYYPSLPSFCGATDKLPGIALHGQDDLCYYLIYADGKTLQVSLVGGRGNTLTYKRVK